MLVSGVQQSDLVYVFMCIWGFSGDLVFKEISGNAGDAGSIPGSTRYPGRGHGNLLQCSCLENSVVIVHRVTKSWAHLNDYYIYVSVKS